MNQDNQPQAECDNCHYPAPKLNKCTGFAGSGNADAEYEFCDVCFSTFLSRATTYPQQYGEQAPLFKSLGYIANMILDEIRKGSAE
jgi:hypothetical protein